MPKRTSARWLLGERFFSELQDFIGDVIAGALNGSAFAENFFSNEFVQIVFGRPVRDAQQSLGHGNRHQGLGKEMIH